MDQQNNSQFNPVPNDNLAPINPKFPLKNIIIIAVLVIAVGLGVYLYTNIISNRETLSSNDIYNTSQVKGVMSTYVDPSGLYTISIPENWIVSNLNEGTVFSDVGKKTSDGVNSNTLTHEFWIHVSNVDPRIELKQMAEYLKNTYSEENLLISSVPSTLVHYSESTAKLDSYVIPLDSKNFMIISVIARDGSEAWLNDSKEIIQSISINTSKGASVRQQADNSRLSIDLINTIKGVIPFAEIYRDSHPDYKNFCASSDISRGVVVPVKQVVGNEYRCTDGVSFAFSSKLPDGKHYCVDSKGFSDNISSLHSGQSCK